MNTRKRVLFVDDHDFFADEVRECLAHDYHCDVVYAKSYPDAIHKIKMQDKPFDFTLLDIILENGKTGVDIAEKYKEFLGQIMFITGCVDESSLKKIDGYASCSKYEEIWPELDCFLHGGRPCIHGTQRIQAQ